jgi:hypothetical protein
MKRQDLELQFACDADVYAMEREGTSCHCTSCDHAVHDLSAMTRREAIAFLAQNEDQRICIQYAYDEDGEVFFAEEQAARWRLFRQIEGLRRMAAAALIAAPLLVAACDAPDHQQIGSPEAQAPAPLVIQDGQPLTIAAEEPGAAKPPAPPAQAVEAAPEVTSEAEVEEPCDKGEQGDEIKDAAPTKQVERVRGRRASIKEPPVKKDKGVKAQPSRELHRTAGKPMMH